MEIAVECERVRPEPAVEAVERKGLGHPDSICDALAEEVSLALCRFYLERFGGILHHNVDKVLLVGGSSRPRFGGGEVTAPIEIFLAGRATCAWNGVAVPVDELAVEAARAWLRANLHGLAVDKHVQLAPRVRPGAPELAALVEPGRPGGARANDTSIGVGFAPLSPLERVVDRVERALNAPARRASDPACGEDVKVMGVRVHGEIHLTVACAAVDRHLADLPAYVEAKRRVGRVAEEAARAETGLPLRIDVNAADDLAAGGIYLTVTGTSAEAGDDGEAGRGNRANGLITPGRPMTMESVAGKNPVSHVGKLYNLAAGLICQAVVEAVPEVRSAECLLVSQIGRPVREPRLAQVRIACDDPRAGAALAPRVRELAAEGLVALDRLWEVWLDGRIAVDRWPLAR
jgi:S-adenosylmethionine synthetase